MVWFPRYHLHRPLVSHIYITIHERGIEMTISVIPYSFIPSSVHSLYHWIHVTCLKAAPADVLWDSCSVYQLIISNQHVLLCTFFQFTHSHRTLVEVIIFSLVNIVCVWPWCCFHLYSDNASKIVSWESHLVVNRYRYDLQITLKSMCHNICDGESGMTLQRGRKQQYTLITLKTALDNVWGCHQGVTAWRHSFMQQYEQQYWWHHLHMEHQEEPLKAAKVKSLILTNTKKSRTSQDFGPNTGSI